MNDQDIVSGIKTAGAVSWFLHIISSPAGKALFALWLVVATICFGINRIGRYRMLHNKVNLTFDIPFGETPEQFASHTTLLKQVGDCDNLCFLTVEPIKPNTDVDMVMVSFYKRHLSEGAVKIVNQHILKNLDHQLYWYCTDYDIPTPKEHIYKLIIGDETIWATVDYELQSITFKSVSYQEPPNLHWP